MKKTIIVLMILLVGLFIGCTNDDLVGDAAEALAEGKYKILRTDLSGHEGSSVVIDLIAELNAGYGAETMDFSERNTYARTIGVLFTDGPEISEVPITPPSVGVKVESRSEKIWAVGVTNEDLLAGVEYLAYNLDYLATNDVCKLIINGVTTDCPTIACYMNSDCGNSSASRYCDGSMAVISSEMHNCTNPGTVNSQCVGGGSGSSTPCSVACNNGHCVDSNTFAIVLGETELATVGSVELEMSVVNFTPSYAMLNINGESKGVAQSDTVNVGGVEVFVVMLDNINEAVVFDVNVDERVMPNPVLHYPFNGDVKDASGNDNGATNFGAILTSDRNGNSNSAYYFDGNDYMTFAVDSLPSGLEARSMCAWAKTDTIASGYKWIVAYGTGSANKAMFIGKSGTDALNGGGYGNDLTSSGFWKVGEWDHICLTYDGTTANLYANGDLIKSSPRSWNLVKNIGRIGRQVNPYNEYWKGSIDDVRIYNTALTQSEIQNIMGGSPAPIEEPNALVAHYELNGGAQDSSGKNNHGTLSGAVSSSDRFGNSNNALSFDGIDDKIVLPSIPALSSEKITISAWMQVDSFPETFTDYAPIVTQYNSNDDGYYLYVKYNRKPSFYIGCGTYLDVESNSSIESGKWYHITGVHDGSTIKIYVDGVLKNTASASGCSGVVEDAYIGFDDVYNDSFAGKIDEVMIHNYALTANEIQTIMGDMPEEPVCIGAPGYEHICMEVTEPNAPTALNEGDLYQIQWVQRGVDYDSVSIGYKRGSSSLEWIEFDTPTVAGQVAQTYLWNVTGLVPAAYGVNLTIYVTGTNGSIGHSVDDESDASVVVSRPTVACYNNSDCTFVRDPLSYCNGTNKEYFPASQACVNPGTVDSTCAFVRETTVCENGCEAGECIEKNLCTGDMAQDIYSAGGITYDGVNYTDSCEEGNHSEYYCNPNDEMTVTNTSCTCAADGLRCIEPTPGTVSATNAVDFRNEIVLENNTDVVKQVIGKTATIDSWAAVEVAGNAELNMYSTITDTDCSGNRIFIGGNCVNDCSAEVLGLSPDPATCAAEFEAAYGQGAIVFVDGSLGKSVVIAGKTADDTMTIASAFKTGAGMGDWVVDSVIPVTTTSEQATTTTEEATTTLAPTCGNGIIEGTEECDDGNTEVTDGCNTNCVLLKIHGPWVPSKQSYDVYVGDVAQITSTYGNPGFDYYCGDGGDLTKRTIYGTINCVYSTSGFKTVEIRHNNATIVGTNFSVLN